VTPLSCVCQHAWRDQQRTRQRSGRHDLADLEGRIYWIVRQQARGNACAWSFGVNGYIIAP